VSKGNNGWATRQTFQKAVILLEDIKPMDDLSWDGSSDFSNRDVCGGLLWKAYCRGINPLDVFTVILPGMNPRPTCFVS
jgi:hypothetical protein